VLERGVGITAGSGYGVVLRVLMYCAEFNSVPLCNASSGLNPFQVDGDHPHHTIDYSSSQEFAHQKTQPHYAQYKSLSVLTHDATGEC
jgi:hypothetical protein